MNRKPVLHVIAQSGQRGGRMYFEKEEAVDWKAQQLQEGFVSALCGCCH
jgi:hypothetical protein